MSCSFNWICTRSSRLGCASTRALRFSRSTSSQFGLGACAVASARVQNRRVLLAASRELRSRRWASPGRTEYPRGGRSPGCGRGGPTGGLRARGAEAHAVDHVVQAALQHVQHVVAGDALHAAGLLEQVAELAFEQSDNSGGPSAFREAAGRSRRSSACDPCRAGRERNCAFRWRTFRCGSARLSGIASCPRAGIAGKRDQYIVPNRTSLYLSQSGAVYGAVRLRPALLLALAATDSATKSNSALLRRPAAVVRNRRDDP